MINRKVAAAAILAVMILFALAVSAVFAHGMPTSKRPNNLGVYETYQNPNTYLLALPVDGKILGEESRFTNVRFQPYNAAAMFDESVLFCGDVSEAFMKASGVVVVTYLTKAAGMYEGIGCHELVSVFGVKP